MADAPAAQQNEDGPPYPTYNERKAKDRKPPLFERPFERLIWPIRGDFPFAIFVMKEPYQNVGDPEPLFNTETGEWHEIATQSITDKKISFVEASLENLNEYDDYWMEFHMEHAEHGDGNCESVAYGDLSDDLRGGVPDEEREEGSWRRDETSNKEILIRCCDEDRPLDKTNLSVEVRPSPGNDFITVRDYVGTVHCWLMSMRDDIQAALLLAEPGWPDDTEWRLANSWDAAPQHRIEIPESWDMVNDGQWNESVLERRMKEFEKFERENKARNELLIANMEARK